MSKKPLYIQLEPGAYPKDIDWQSMTPSDRGCYHSLIIYLACSNGSLPNDTEKLAMLCNINVQDFEKFWKSFSRKFIEKNGEIEHKRVSEEIKKSRKNIRQKSLAGKASAKKRAAAVERPLNGGGTADELREEKRREEKISKKEHKQLFEETRKLYPGTKKGLDPEWDNFIKKHRDWREKLPLLEGAVKEQISRRNKAKQGEFVPQWKNFSTWINQSCWTEEPAHQPKPKEVYSGPKAVLGIEATRLEAERCEREAQERRRA